jgi:acetyltransferase-like isoleucine patch superfamily enzyme
VTTTIHPTAEVHPEARIGDGCRIWHQAQVREGATLGPGCIVGKGAYIGEQVTVGANCKIQNYACLYPGVSLDDGVFIGPHVVFTNDRLPRAINPDGSLKSDADWHIGPITVARGASLGSRAVILPGLSIGRWALVGAGSVVTKDVEDHALVAGNPARHIGWVCVCATRLAADLRCPECGRAYVAADNGLEQAAAASRT